MATNMHLDTILNSKSKIAIIRLLVSKTGGFKATGRAIATLTHFSAPAAHTALKELLNQGIVHVELLGNQHIYSLDANNRMVQKILRPIFKEETSLKDEIRNFLILHLQRTGMKQKIVSLILYGSMQQGTMRDGSDVDIAVIIKNKKDTEEIEGKFLHTIATQFHDYFKAHLDPYIKTAAEFRARLKKNLPPVSTLMKSYSVLYGKEPLEI